MHFQWILRCKFWPTGGDTWQFNLFFSTNVLGRISLQTIHLAVVQLKYKEIHLKIFNRAYCKTVFQLCFANERHSLFVIEELLSTARKIEFWLKEKRWKSLWYLRVGAFDHHEVNHNLESFNSKNNPAFLVFYMVNTSSILHVSRGTSCSSKSNSPIVASRG